MKQEQLKKNERRICNSEECLCCQQCGQINYEEIRSAVPELKAASDLYAAEAQHYYFYFTKNKDRVLR